MLALRDKNRAWFLHDDRKFYQSVHVVYDRKENTLDSLMDLLGGKVIDTTNLKPIVFNVMKSKKATLDYLLKWDFLHNSTRVLLANEKALKVLNEVVQGEFQALLAEVRMYDGTVINDYYIINVIIRKDMMNKEKSILKPEEERESWDMYEKCFYDISCLGGSEIAIDDDSKITLGSENLRRAVREAKLTGLEFNESWGGICFIE
ncbi:hypothetical protein NF27_CL00040 [Candidatus Jidaibacter acanthamoeba]|uniref:Immunity MXAN-0049 protein domain-containing protein n=1 Tax=Candidatus Jidaibacter acanthamoebae TaxID=86105 RepID=A0A0C1R0G3_9RICK|nr:DUF1629 domain-containing protein [Candidatus Jidaibacter acanthamoeba]KIE05805.1 hypothetical protein NF27_CL00040 [Candidatus Jidaibacter acanthamoeba]